MEFKAQMQTFQQRVEDAISALLPAMETPPPRIHEAMHYSMAAGGKRLRPVLLIATAELLGAREDPFPAAVALECLHTYSLIHDDLPAMDDSDLRRGRPTCHKAFDEATAVLAGDALLTFSFELLARHYAHDPALSCALVSELAAAAGSRKLIGGQMQDILSERNGAFDEETLRFIHLNKTAALIECCLASGALIARADNATVNAARNLGRHLGLAFQLIDDLLDVTRDTASLGKPAGLDAVNGTATAIHLFGQDETRRRAEAHTRDAVELCRSLPGDTAFLDQLILSMQSRIS